MENEENKFDVIDLDPITTPINYIENAVLSLKEGGLLCATFTDLETLCGSNTH